MADTYAILIGVGDYEKAGMPNLPTYRMDLAMIGTAFESGLQIPAEHIRLLVGEDNQGYVHVKDFAYAIADMKGKLEPDDRLIFYFSGHGKNGEILFSDGQISLQSVVDYLAEMPVKARLLLLDCCYSGEFTHSGAPVMQHEETISDFVDKGIAVFASSSANEMSRLGPDGRASVFTGALSSAILLHDKKQGVISFYDIYDNTMRLIDSWNRENPDMAQQPVFRSNISGRFLFHIGEKETSNIIDQGESVFECEEYKIISVKSLSTRMEKRLAVFVIPSGGVEPENLAAITRKVAEWIRYQDYDSEGRVITRSIVRSADVVWCYFGQDMRDIRNGLHFAYTIWGIDKTIADKYFRQIKASTIVDGIYIWENTSYRMLKQMQQPTRSMEEYIDELKELRRLIISLAEKFAFDLQEVANRTMTVEKLQVKYKEWVRLVEKSYLLLTDEDVPPDALHDWANEILDLAGWVVDLSILVKGLGKDGIIRENELWLMKNALRHYREAIEKLKEIEETMGEVL